MTVDAFIVQPAELAIDDLSFETALPSHADAKPRTCLSCGAPTNERGELPCGH